MRLEADGSIYVVDRARGIPVDIEPRTKLSGVEVVFTKLHAGGKFGAGSYNATGGLHGVGASVVNALSVRLDVDVDRDGATWSMSFRRGVPGVFDGDGPDAPFTPGGGLRKTGRVAKGVHGTRVRYWPDRQIFLAHAELSRTQLLARARQTSFLVPGLELVVTDAREAEPVTEVFKHDGGISEFCDYLAADPPVTEVIRLQGTDKFTETVPMLDDAGSMTATDVERTLDVDIALRWGTGYDTHVQSFVNIIATPKGGTHLAGFERGLTRAFLRGLDGTRLLKAGEEIIKDDALEGLTAVVTVRLAEPQFEGQTKEVLGTPPVTRLVTRIVEAELTDFLTSTKAAARTQARAVMEKVVAASRTRAAGPCPQGGAAPQERARIEHPAGEARRLPQHRPRPHRTVHRRGRLRARHREAGAGLGVPGAAADPRQDPERAEGLGRRHAEERRVRLDHPGGGGRLGAHVRPRGRPVLQGDLHGGRRLRRRPHPHACWRRCSSSTCARWSRPAGCTPPSRRCTGSS